MSRGVIGLFMKAPVPGRCKTRLQPFLTAEQAAALYRAFCLDVAATASRAGVELRVVYDAAADFPTPGWAAPGASFLLQQGADLGARLVHAFDALFREGFHQVVIIGTDAPTMPVTALTEAFTMLSRHDAVFAPAEDGGYGLVGLTAPRPALFEGMAWSTPAVMPATRKKLTGLGLSVGYLPVVRDIDTPADLAWLRRELASLPADVAPATCAALGPINR